MPAPTRPQHATKSLKSIPPRQNVTRTKRAGLIFPVARVRRQLRKDAHAVKLRVATNADIFLTATLEYLTAEVCELAGVAAETDKKRRITARHVMMAVRGDEELNELLKNVTIPEAGVLPGIHENLLPPDKRKQATPEE